MPLQWPIKTKEHYYIYYQFCYQIAVCISRTSVRWIRIRQVSILSASQVALLIFFIVQGNTI